MNVILEIYLSALSLTTYFDVLLLLCSLVLYCLMRFQMTVNLYDDPFQT
jgi:hypothetical protein